MPDTLIKVDLKDSPYNNDKVHNRWHPTSDRGMGVAGR